MKKMHNLLKLLMVVSIFGMATQMSFAEDPAPPLDDPKYTVSGDKGEFLYSYQAILLENETTTLTIWDNVNNEAINDFSLESGNADLVEVSGQSLITNEILGSTDIIISINGGDDSFTINVTVQANQHTIEEFTIESIVGDTVLLGSYLSRTTLAKDLIYNVYSSTVDGWVNAQTGAFVAQEAGYSKVYAYENNTPVATWGIQTGYDSVFATSITTMHSTYSMWIFDSFDIVYTIEPANADNDYVIFSSSDETIATVDYNGIVTGVGQGEAVITVSIASDPSITTEVLVTVVKEGWIEEIVTPESFISIPKGETKHVEYSVLPHNVPDNSVTFTIADDSIAIVSAYGEVTGISVGTTVLTIISNEDPTVTAEVEINIADKEILPEAITILSNQNVIQTGEEFFLEYAISPYLADKSPVVFESSDASIITVDENGLVTAIAEGVAEITVLCVDNPSVLTTLTIEVRPTHTTEYVTMDADSIIDLSHYGPRAYYEYDTELFSEVSPGVFYGQNYGTATFHVTILDTGNAIVTVIEKQQFESIHVTGLIGESIALRKYLSEDLLARDLFFHNMDKSFNSWVDSLSGEFNCTEHGLYIVNVLENGDLLAKVYVNTTEDSIAAVEIVPNETEITLYIDETVEVLYTVIPANALNDVVYSIDNPSVATVTSNGIVTSSVAGTAILTMTSISNPEVVAEVLITVIENEPFTIHVSDYDVIDLRDDFNYTPGIRWVYNPDELIMFQDGVFFPRDPFASYFIQAEMPNDAMYTFNAEILHPLDIEVIYNEVYISTDSLLDARVYLNDMYGAKAYYNEEEFYEIDSLLYIFTAPESAGMVVSELGNVTFIHVDRIQDSVIIDPPMVDVIVFEGKRVKVDDYLAVNTPVYYEVVDPEIVRVTNSGQILGLQTGGTEVLLFSESTNQLVGILTVTVIHRGLYDPANIDPDVVTPEIIEIEVKGANTIKITLTIELEDVEGLEEYIYVKIRYKTGLKSEIVESKMILVSKAELESANTLVLEMEEDISYAEGIELVFLEGGLLEKGGNTLSSNTIPFAFTTDISTKETLVTVSPNPATDIITVEGAQAIDIVSMSGNTLVSITDMASTSQINISNLPAGAFMLQLKTENGTQFIQLIKQ